MRRLTPAALLLPAPWRQLLDEEQLLLCSFLAEEEPVLVQPANWPAKIPVLFMDTGSWQEIKKVLSVFDLNI